MSASCMLPYIFSCHRRIRRSTLFTSAMSTGSLLPFELVTARRPRSVLTDDFNTLDYIYQVLRLGLIAEGTRQRGCVRSCSWS